MLKGLYIILAFGKKSSMNNYEIFLWKAFFGEKENTNGFIEAKGIPKEAWIFFKKYDSVIWPYIRSCICTCLIPY